MFCKRLEFRMDENDGWKKTPLHTVHCSAPAAKPSLSQESLNVDMGDLELRSQSSSSQDDFDGDDADELIEAHPDDLFTLP